MPTFLKTNNSFFVFLFWVKPNKIRLVSPFLVCPLFDQVYTEHKRCSFFHFDVKSMKKIYSCSLVRPKDGTFTRLWQGWRAFSQLLIVQAAPANAVSLLCCRHANGVRVKNWIKLLISECIYFSGDCVVQTCLYCLNVASPYVRQY